MHPSLKEIYIRTTLLGFCRERFSLHRSCFSFLSYYLWFTVHVVWSIEVWILSSLSTNLLYWALWVLIYSSFGRRNQNPPLQNIYQLATNKNNFYYYLDIITFKDLSSLCWCKNLTLSKSNNISLIIQPKKKNTISLILCMFYVDVLPILIIIFTVSKFLDLMKRHTTELT